MSGQGVGTAWLIAALLLTSRPAAAQLVTGRVIEEGTDSGIASVTIELTDTTGVRRGGAVTDTAGHFRIVAPRPGRYILRLTHVAYAPLQTRWIDATTGTGVELELRLNPTAVALEPLRVVGRSHYDAGWLEEYYERAVHTRKLGVGRVFFRDEVERERPPYISSFLIYLMPRGGCRPTLFLDGLEVENASTLDAMLTPDQLEGVELYNNAAFLPARYANRGHCAIALFWTRRDIENGKPFTWKRLLVAGGVLSAILLLFGM